jgi:hypothetical protein
MGNVKQMETETKEREDKGWNREKKEKSILF